MAKNTILGSLKTTHTVSARESTSATAYYNVSNPENIRVGSTISIDGTNNIAGLYVVVRAKNAYYNGQTWDIQLNWTISTSYLPVNGTFYADYDTYGMKVGKKNVDTANAGPKDLIFDSRLRRRGVIYAQGFQAQNTSQNFSFKRGDDFLNYIPLITHTERNQGFFSCSTIGSTAYFANNEIREQMQFKEDAFAPIRAAYYQNTGPRMVIGASVDTTVFRVQPGNSCDNVGFKALRIPCGYGFMTEENFENPETTDTTRGSGGLREVKDKKRVITGQITNSTAGFTSSGGLFVSRPGTDVLTCEIDDYLLATDTGVGDVAFRGEEQKLAMNYSSVITANSVPSLTANTSTTANNQTVSLSFFNPYTEIALPTITTQSATTELAYTATQDRLYTNYEFTLTTPSLFKFSLERKVYDLALF